MHETPLHDECRKVMATYDREAHPRGLTAVEILEHIRKDDPDAFPLITVIDIADTMSEIYWSL
jgi:hypothetical protein